MDRKVEDREVPRHEAVKVLLDRLRSERQTGELLVRLSQGSVTEAYTNLKAL